MREEPRGEEQWVSHCGDSDVVVDVVELVGSGGGFREKRKKRQESGRMREACLCRVHGATRSPLQSWICNYARYYCFASSVEDEIHWVLMRTFSVHGRRTVCVPWSETPRRAAWKVLSGIT